MAIAREINRHHSQFVRRVRELHKVARAWLKEVDPKARTRELSVSIEEVGEGKHSAPALEIHRSQRPVVTLVPVAWRVVGAEGRVDMRSVFGSESLLYLLEEGLRIQDMTSKGQEIGHSRRRKQVDIAQGWVWAQNKRAGLYPSLDIDLFFRLLEVLGHANAA